MKDRILELVQQYETIILHRHERPDEDAYGSQCGLAAILKASFPKKKIYCVGKEAESLTYLASLDVLPDTAWENALAIVTDTANTERIDDKRYALAATLIKIDHHPNRDPYGDVCWVDTTASSTSELIYEWYLHCQACGLILGKEAAALLYAGIVGDTGRFLYPSTTSKTLRYAGELIDTGFDRTTLHNNMVEEPLNMVKLQGYILEHFEIVGNEVGKVFITKAVREQFQVSAADCSRLVSVLGSIKGIKVWALFSEDEQIRVNLRSKGPTINQIAEKYGGGGHPLASGANVADWETAGLLVEDLVQLMQ